MRKEPCNKCGAYDYYTRGEFSYCRSCHSEAQKRYMARKRIGDEVDILKPPAVSLADMTLGKALPLTCKNGHYLKGNNVRMSSQRNQRNLKRRCKVCERNAKRVRYGLAPEAAPTKLSELLDS